FKLIFCIEDKKKQTKYADEKIIAIGSINDILITPRVDNKLILYK
ncbi:MAG: hypothetical protein QG646_3675, partial [Euryarchaeota archaeon]|nr:hypothetical protein [Euryarchaeota archaeon]